LFLVIIDCGFLRWCAVQLLQKLSIRASNGPDKLMRIVKQPVTRYLPLGARRIGMSYSAPKVVQLSDYVAAAGLSSTYVFVVGAMAHGKIDADYIDDLVAVSEYPLSAMWCIARICNSFEQLWHIL
jgi:rRNA small subunit pseudouridine methyltransferase Nep1